MLTVDLFSVYLLPSVDIVIRYIDVDFSFGLPDYVRYIEEFVISRFYCIKPLSTSLRGFSFYLEKKFLEVEREPWGRG